MSVSQPSEMVNNSTLETEDRDYRETRASGTGGPCDKCGLPSGVDQVTANSKNVAQTPSQNQKSGRQLRVRPPTLYSPKRSQLAKSLAPNKDLPLATNKFQNSQSGVSSHSTGNPKGLKDLVAIFTHLNELKHFNLNHFSI
jgi:hypothetical protein